MKDNKNRKNNNRDVILGMTVIVLTYIFVGITFYLIYPGWKDCINDVFINVINFEKFSKFYLKNTIFIISLELCPSRASHAYSLSNNVRSLCPRLSA